MAASTPASVGAPAASQPSAAPSTPAPSGEEHTNPEAPQPETAPPPAEPSAPAAPPATGLTLEQQIEQETDPDKLQALLDEAERIEEAAAPKKKKGQASKAATAPATPAAPAAAKPASEPPAPSPEEDPENAPTRLWMKSLPAKDRALLNGAVQMVREAAGEGRTISIRDALAELTESTPTAAPAPAAPNNTPAEPESRIPHFDVEIKKQDDLITDLRQKRDTARTQYDDKLADQITEEIQDAKILKDRLIRQKEDTAAKEAKEKSDREESAKFQEGYDRARSIALRILPGSATPGHPDYDAVTREIQRLEQEEPEKLDDPTYPVDIALKIREAKSDTPPSRPETLLPEPKRSAREVPPQVGAEATTDRPLDRATLLAKIEDMTDEELDQLADAVGTKAPDVRKRR